jgi:hypothetical protein
MSQPVPAVSGDDVTRAIERDFPPTDRADVRATLDKYTAGDGPVPPARVHLAILKLSGGDTSKVVKYVEDARLDYRDVLAWAEYPRYFAQGGFDTDADEKQAIDDDWAEYQSWLGRK